ncbi:hypothetical protein [Streptococcus sp. zg-JUN1979]|uniref:hypothetical protein n=1 Tax=Streptococcus sp. zg-JUN1979 TaxID=3391450 RepID=UPI0039A5448C
MRKLRYLIRRYPREAALLLFNTGIFTYLRAIIWSVLDRLGIDSTAYTLPSWLSGIEGDFWLRLPWLWAIASVILSVWSRFWRRRLRLIMTCLMIALGIYMLISYSYMFIQ